MSYINFLHKDLRASRAVRSFMIVILLLAGLSARTLEAQPPPLPWQPTIQRHFPVESPGIPAYARLELLLPNFDVPNNEKWAAIVFYRDPECVPADFNLGEFFDPPIPPLGILGAFGCPLLVEGYEIWQDLPIPEGGTAAAPVFVRSHNATPSLPIWFVAWHELKPLLQSGQVYINDIASLPSLRRGLAHEFEEQLYPNFAAPEPGISLHAEGRLVDGGRFRLDWNYSDGGEIDEVFILLWQPFRKFRW